jgi:hypothetical protein
MEPKHYVYRPNIWLVLAITFKNLALYRNLLKYYASAVLYPRPTTDCQVESIFANQISWRSSTSHNLLEPKFRLLRAITFKILAVYRNLVKYCPSAFLHPRPTTGYQVEIIFANQIGWRSSTSHNLLEPKSCLLLAITYEIVTLYRNLVKYCASTCCNPFQTNNRLSEWYHLCKSNQLEIFNQP